MKKIANTPALQFSDDGDGTLNIKGALTFDTASAALLPVEKWVSQQKTVGGQIDLREVTQCDSAGVALLVAWTRFAKQKRRTIQFVHVPSQLMTMARVSGLETILPVI